jgi:superfamily II DNA or RNA helicase
MKYEITQADVPEALEGTDVPSCKCIVHARPTQSTVLWRQSTGRALRPDAKASL